MCVVERNVFALLSSSFSNKSFYFLDFLFGSGGNKGSVLEVNRCHPRENVRKLWTLSLHGGRPHSISFGGCSPPYKTVPIYHTFLSICRCLEAEGTILPYILFALKGGHWWGVDLRKLELPWSWHGWPLTECQLYHSFPTSTCPPLPPPSPPATKGSRIGAARSPPTNLLPGTACFRNLLESRVQSGAGWVCTVW